MVTDAVVVRYPVYAQCKAAYKNNVASRKIVAYVFRKPYRIAKRLSGAYYRHCQLTLQAVYISRSKQQNGRIIYILKLFGIIPVVNCDNADIIPGAIIHYHLRAFERRSADILVTVRRYMRHIAAADMLIRKSCITVCLYHLVNFRVTAAEYLQQIDVILHKAL